MSKWEMVNLTDVVSEVITGEWGTECDECTVGTKVLRTTNFTNIGTINYDIVALRNIPASKLDKKKLKRHDIILEKSGGSDNQPVGRVVYFNNESEDIYLCNNFTQVLRIKQSTAFAKYVFLFLFYLYQNGTTELLQNKTTGIRNLQIKQYMSLEIPLPPLRVQQKIVDILEKTSALIEKRKAQIDKLDLLIKSQFIEMFGDPVTNPKGWEKKPMGHYLSVLTDFSANGSYEYLDSSVVMFDEPNYALMIRTTDLERQDFLFNVKYICKEAYEVLGKSKLFGGEIIMNKIGSAGKVYLMPTLDYPASLGRNAFMFRYRENINVIFVYYLLTSRYGNKEIAQHVRGAVTKTITKDAVRSIPVIVPPITIQNKFADFVQQVDEQKKLIRQSLKKLELKYKSLMQKCFRGDLF